MKTLLATLAVLFACTESSAQARPPARVDDTGYEEGYGILLSGAAPIDWYGEPMFLMWSWPRSANSAHTLHVVTVDLDEDALISLRVGVELVGFAAYDPRPCALGNTAVLSTTGGARLEGGPPYVIPCGTTLYATIGLDGMGYNFPAHSPLLQASDCYQSPIESATYVVSYFSDPPYFTNHVSGCGDGLQPVMGFILGRLVLL